MDNHKAHHSIKVRDYLVKKGATVLFLPVGLSELNPIERVWGIMKKKWANRLCELKGEIDPMQVFKELRVILKQISEDTVQALAQNDKAAMIRILQA